MLGKERKCPNHALDINRKKYRTKIWVDCFVTAFKQMNQLKTKKSGMTWSMRQK